MEPLYTAAELADAQAYHAPIYTAALVDFFAGPLVLALVAKFIVPKLYAWAPAGSESPRSPLTRLWGDSGWKKALGFALLYFLVLAAINLPLSVWLGYVREHQFGLSTESLGSYVVDALKGHAVMLASVSALTFGLFGLARKTKHWWWLVGAASALVMVASTAIDPYRARLYVDQTPLPEGELRTAITALLQKAEVPFSDVLVVHTAEKSVRVQAAFAGTGPTRTILLTDTLLASMTRNEVLAAIAHEAGHVHESRWLGRVLAPLAVFALLGFLEFLFRRAARSRWYGITERGDVRVLPLLVLAFDLSLQAAAPISAAASRQRERNADLYAVSVTNDATSLITLLSKLGRINKIDPSPPRWYVLMGVTHPTIVERIALLQKNATPPPMTPVNAGTSVQQAPGVMR